MRTQRCIMQTRMRECPHLAGKAVEIGGIDDDGFNGTCLHDTGEDSLGAIAGINDDTIVMICREIFRYENPAPSSPRNMFPTRTYTVRPAWAGRSAS